MWVDHMRYFLAFISITILISSNAFARDKYFGTPSKISDWKISCTVDDGSITGGGADWVFTTSKNRCLGDKTNKQRAEINTKKAISLSTKGKYNFQAIFTMNSARNEKFDIFQIHDGRDGCAPPLKVNIQANGKLRLYSDYQKGPGEQCERDVMQSTGLGKTSIKLDGTEYKLNVILDFDGKSGFDIEVHINDVLEVSGKYFPPEGSGYIKSKYFYFKHGVYSRNMFDYELKSKISMNLVK